ncbi:hypothetical protein TNCV_2626911 [Trichonephila clavipes]|uniref:Uncharacterized protein n=1 Tax=Trichonephila clavipes TaxID=2585209 RepID=A0A8X7BF74_TRICX|nr:hypothetical protein TNCV_2626911 [Trichonephila clavipes]
MQAVIPFLWAKNVSASAMSRQHVAKLCHSFQSGRQDVEGAADQVLQRLESPRRSFEHRTGDRMIWLLPTPVLHPDPTFLPLPPIARKELRLYECLELPHVSQPLFILQTSIPFPRFEPRPYGPAVSVTNRYTDRRPA